MEIADYIPNYPEINDPGFNNDIFHKKEFYDLRTKAEPQPFGKPGDLWNHQKLLARFLSPDTPYNEILLFHTPGTGKTCAASAIVEINKQDPIIRKPTLIIVPNETLATQWKKQIALVCTAGQYVPDNFYSKDPNERLTTLEKTVRLNKALAGTYRVITMEKMRRRIDKTPDEILKRDFSNKIIIIDEAHNLRIQTHTTQKNRVASKGRYLAFHRFLHAISNSKIVLLTGTPMYDRANELPSLMNLILPINKQLPTGTAFTKKYLEKGVLKNRDELFDHLRGRVSYIREGGNFPKRIDLGEPKFTNFIKTVNLEMSETQLEGYKMAVEADAKGETGLLKNTRQAAVFVYKKGEEYLWGEAASKVLTTRSKRPTTIKIRDRNVSYYNTFINSKYTADIKANLREYSAKYAYIIDYLKKNPRKPTFIFTPLVSGTGGAIFLGLILGLSGFGKAMGNERQAAKRYALITGEDKSSTQREALIDIFNSPQNKNGEIIQVLIASMTISVGTNFTNVQEEIVVSPYWNNSGTVQAIGRGLRANSLLHMKKENRVVKVQQLAVTGAKDNTDAHMYKMSEDKETGIKLLERVLKEAAFDCPLNYDRNVREIDDDYSRECDYQKCNYKCDGVQPTSTNGKWTYSIPQQELDRSTYILYYAQPEMLQIVDRIKEILRRFSYININGLDKLLKPESFKLMVLAIKYMIENHVTVYNKWGQQTFLRKEGNMLFLSDIPTEDSILGSWYSRYPYANSQIPLSQVIDGEILKGDLAKLDGCKTGDMEVIETLSLEARIFIVEALLADDKTVFNSLKQIFKNNLFEIKGVIVHDLEKVKMDIDYTDFALGDGGNLRCLDGVWRDCTKKEEEVYSKEIKKYREEQNADVIDQQLYGILTTDGKFKIADRTKETNKSDGRKKYRGRDCSTWDKWRLIEVYVRLNIVPDKLIEETSKRELIKIIEKENVENAVPQGANNTVLRRIATLAKLSKKDLCAKLQREFEARGLLLS